ncbi:hypothetical protein FACS1894140_5240 [Spirochaetia bacterium]|nr:hypothetical protein FACS1894140_5240 [Spirochaetia bacterium]
MITIQQTIDIPADGRIHLDFALPLPKGSAEITLTVKPARKPGKLPGEHRSIFHRKSVMDYYGCLKGSPAFEGDPMDIQRELRDEWN